MDRFIAKKAKWFGGILIPILVFSTSIAMAATKPIGRVMMAQGRIQLVHADGTEMVARGGTYFLSGDTFKTSSKSRAQLRFEDGTLISLRPKSEFQVNEYNYDPKNKNNNRSIFSLVKGGFSTVSGWLGKLKPEGYEVRTPVAIVGIRGTHYELVLEDGLSAAVWQGGISIKNKAADLKLGYGASFNYAHVTSINKPPVGLLRPPTSIHPQAADLYVEGKDETLKAEEKTTTSSSESEGDGSVTAIVDDPTIDPTTDPANADEGTVLATATGTVDATGTAVDPGAGVSYGPVVAFDLVTNPAIQRAFGVFAGVTATSAGSKPPLVVGFAPDLSLGGGFIYDPNLVYGGTPGVIVDSTGATNTTSGAYLVDGSGVAWGQWAGTKNVYTDPNDKAFVEQATDPFYWLTAVQTATMPTTGAATYTLNSFVGSGTAGLLTANAGTFSTKVNFATGQLNGTLDFTDTKNNWVTDFSGGINGADFNANLNTTSTVNGVGATGVIHGAFSGTNAASYGSVFDFVAVDNSVYAAGAMVATQNFFLSPTDIVDLNTVNRVAIASFGNLDFRAEMPLIGGATDLSSGGKATNQLLFDAKRGVIMRPAATTYSFEGSFTTANFLSNRTTAFTGDIQWGDWDTANLQTDPADGSVGVAATTGLKFMSWISMTPTATMPITGTKTYTLNTTANSLYGSAAGGTIVIQQFDAQATFTPAGGTIGGTIDITDGATNGWAATWTADILGTTFNTAAPGAGNTLADNSAAPQDLNVTYAPVADGFVAGGFSGTNAEAIGGAFHLQDATATKYVGGTFVMTQ